MKQTVYTTLLILAFVMGVAAQKGVTKQSTGTVKANLVNSLKARILNSRVPASKNASGGGDENQLTFDLAGIQSAMAEYDSMNDLYRDNSFVLNGGMKPFVTHMNVKFDYNVDPMDTNHSIISGGKWSLVVYDEDYFVGVIYGDVAAGEITTPLTEIPVFTARNSGSTGARQINAQFRITGGTDEFSDLFPDGIDRPFSSFSATGDGNAPTTATISF